MKTVPIKHLRVDFNETWRDLKAGHLGY